MTGPPRRATPPADGRSGHGPQDAGPDSAGAAASRGRAGGAPGLTACALAAVAGAHLARPVPVAALVALAAAPGAAVALVGRAPAGAAGPARRRRAARVVALAALVATVALAASARGARAWDQAWEDAGGPVAGRARLVTDPEEVGPSVRAEVRLEGRRLEAWFRGPDAGTVRSLLAGEGVSVAGRVAPLDPGADRWLAVRHVTGSLTVEEVTSVHPATGPAAVANRLRRLLARGAEPLGPDQQALYLGVVVGDDRRQSPLVADDFRATGLSHLLAVSGQNVALVLVVAEPVLRRRGPAGRLLLTVGLLGFFALVTRCEPSVLRATTMAALAATGTALGRPADGLRALAAAVVALVLVDPLLAHALGFQLSVLASLAILILGARLAALVPGPRVVAESLAVTLAAQAGVLPLLVTTFGGVPVATVPANVVAGPAVGPLAAWGLTAGVVAGVAPGPVAAVLALPAAGLSTWILATARTATALRLGEVGAPAGLLLALAAGAVMIGRGRRWLGVLGWGVVVAVLGAALVQARTTGAPHQVVATGVELWQHREGTVVAVGASARPGQALVALRRAGVGAVDLLVVADRGRSAAEAAAALAGRYRPAQVWVPAPVPAGWDATTPPLGSTWSVGPGLVVTVVATAPVLVVEVAGAGGAGRGAVRPGVRFGRCTCGSVPTATTSPTAPSSWAS